MQVVCQKQVINDDLLCQAAWGNLVLLWGWGCEEPEPNSACAEPHAAGTSSAPQRCSLPQLRDRETRARPESGPQSKLDFLGG